MGISLLDRGQRLAEVSAVALEEEMGAASAALEIHSADLVGRGRGQVEVA